MVTLQCLVLLYLAPECGSTDQCDNFPQMLRDLRDASGDNSIPWKQEMGAFHPNPPLSTVIYNKMKPFILDCLLCSCRPGTFLH